MIVNLNITRQKRGDEVWEIFTVTPNHNMMYDPKRFITFVLWQIRSKLAMTHVFNLKKIVETGNIITYIYYFNPDESKLVDLSFNIQIPYYPIMGKRTCGVCRFERIIDGKKYCHWKGIEIGKYSFYKCPEWVEKSLNSRQDKHVHKQKRSNTMGATSYRVP